MPEVHYTIHRALVGTLQTAILFLAIPITLGYFLAQLESRQMRLVLLLVYFHLALNKIEHGGALQFVSKALRMGICLMMKSNDDFILH